MAHTIYIRGVPENKQVTEVRVRAAPGTDSDTSFKAPVGATAVCQDVQPDPKGEGFNNQTYHWFKLSFPDNRGGWVRDDLLDVEGDLTQFGYGTYQARTFAFLAATQMAAASAASTEAGTNAAPATASIPAAPQTAAPAPSAGQVDPAAAQPAAATNYTAIVNVNKANLRNQPSRNSNQVGFLLNKTQIPVESVEKSQDGDTYRWIKTHYNDLNGYLREDLLTFGPECAALGLGATQVQQVANVMSAARANPTTFNSAELYASPLKVSYRVFQEYGDTRFGSAHLGIDLTGGNVENSSVFSSGSGIVHNAIPCTRCTPDKPTFQSQGLQFWDANAVRDVAWGYGFGNHVIVRYAWADLPSKMRDALMTRNISGYFAYVIYAHLNRIDVSQGQQISEATQIGLLGNTGNSTGAHLHLEVHVSANDNDQSYFRGQTLDPRNMYQI